MKLLKIIVILVVPIIILLNWWNKSIVTTKFTVTDKDIPKNFSDFRIAQVSDLHNASFGFGNNNSKLINKIQNEDPNIIVITGDMIDSRRTDFEVGLEFIKQVIKIAPTYYVIGNHETRIYEGYLELEQEMKNLGVHVLRNQSENITIDEQSIQIIDVDDPDIYDSFVDTDSLMKDLLTELDDPNQYSILLSHRPELFDIYCETNMNLVFSGHVHGGQVRLPIVGGLVGPNQGLLPEYDSGIYTNGSTNLIVSRGLGNSLFPFRINNRPELIITTLQHES